MKCFYVKNLGIMLTNPDLTKPINLKLNNVIFLLTLTKVYHLYI